MGEPRAHDPGDAVSFESATNYPAFLSRGAVCIIDRAARGGPRRLAVQPMAPNGQARLRPVGRVFGAEPAAATEFGLLGAVCKHFGNKVEVRVGDNFDQFSDDLTDLTRSKQGLFVNSVTTF